MMARAVAGLSRPLVLLWCVTTALYALVASSPFANAQFLEPRVFEAVGRFADWHGVITWAAVAAFAASFPRGRGSSATVTLARVSTVAGVLFASWNSWHPLVPGLIAGRPSIFIGVASMLPVLALALIDHLAAWAWLRERRRPLSELERRGSEARWLVSAFATVAYVTVVYALVASVRLTNAVEPDLTGAATSGALAVTAADLSLVFAGLFVTAALTGRLLAGRFRRHYFVLLALIAGGAAWFLSALLGSALGMRDDDAWFAAIGLAAPLVLIWGGGCVRRAATRHQGLDDPLDLLFPRYGGHGGQKPALVVLAGVVPLAALLVFLSTALDWDFVVLKLGVAVVCTLSFALVLSVTPPRPGIGRIAALTACVTPLAAQGLVAASLEPHTLERYAVYNPSTYVFGALVRPTARADAFDRFLRAHTGLTDHSVAPIDIDVVGAPLPPPLQTPHIFLLVVDSLRADYLSPYNPQVTFTPNIAALAAEGVTFTRSFTRYGGTGLSMPAIWAGSAVAHKQYVLPFQRMNALEKLVDAGQYRRIMGRDHITEALWQHHSNDIELDRGRPEMEFEFCRTLDEIASTVALEAPAGRPLFAQTRALNLHVASVRYGHVPPGRSYPGFQAPYAYRIERMDGCLGEFVGRLKQLDVYDRSLIVLTSDHGELTGEDGRWGHSHHLFPQVAQTPLVLRLPRTTPALRVDPGAVAFSTDITPTLYRLLGYHPRASGSLAGRPLFDDSLEALTDRRRTHYVLAASYGAVYAVVSRNGGEIYIADAIKGADYVFQRNPDDTWRQSDVDPPRRALGRLRIQRFVDEIARDYRLQVRF